VPAFATLIEPGVSEYSFSEIWIVLRTAPPAALPWLVVLLPPP
jgi:hypothetical protein